MTSPSTKEKMKEVALSLFSSRGYVGTSMSEIAREVGIKKASLYSHYESKEALFFAVYEELAADYETLHERIISESEKLDPEGRLFYLFREYILYYWQNPVVQGFWVQINNFAPPELHNKYYENISRREQIIGKRISMIFSEAMDSGVLRQDDPMKMVLSFRSMCEGLLNWMLVIKGFKEEWIEDIWRDLFLGMKRRNKK